MKAFVIATGQDDNLGDVVLRRRWLTALQPATQVHIYVGNATQGFIDGLGTATDNESRLYRSFLAWLAAGTLAALREPIALCHNAGELNVTHRSIVRFASLMPATLLARLRGGEVIRAGQGARSSGGILWKLFKWIVRWDTLTAWRDEQTRQYMGRGRVVPDWAFGEFSSVVWATGHEPARRYLTINMRYDRPEPSQEWYDGIKKLAAMLGLRIIVAPQVRRDNQRGARIAATLNTDFCAWNASCSHVQREDELRTLYQESDVVVSDRLHALIMGFTEGAVPIGVHIGPDRKISRHLSASGVTNASFDSTGLTAIEVAERCMLVYGRRSQMLELRAKAASAVQELERDIQRLLV